MAIRFTFTLNDVDAENLVDCINESRRRLIEDFLEASSLDEAKNLWLENHIAYLDSLKARVLSNQERVPDMPEHEVGK